MKTCNRLQRPEVSHSSACISWTSVDLLIIFHTNYTFESQMKLLKYKAFSLGFAEAQFLHASVVIPGDCQNSCRDRPETTKLNTTKLPKGAAGCSQLLSSI